MKKKHVFSGVFVLLVAIISAVVFTNVKETNLNQTVKESASELIRPYSPIKGGQDARVTIVEFLDPACETCRQFYPFVKSALAAYPEKIRLVVRHAPFHQGSDEMIKILEAAKLQGKYWETLEIMLKEQANWTEHHKAKPELIWKYLVGMGLDLDQVRKDMNSPEVVARVEQDLADTKGFKVTRTPGFFVNGKPLTSFGYKQLKALIESELQKNY